MFFDVAWQQEYAMDDGQHKLDEVTERLIAAQQVCPFIPDCDAYHICNRPEQNTFYHAIHFCGDRFIHCRLFKEWQTRQNMESDLSGCSGCPSRASPAKDGA
jgi:hypothetical protein